MGTRRTSQTSAGYARGHWNQELFQELLSITRRGKSTWHIRISTPPRSRMVWHSSHGIHMAGSYYFLFLLLEISCLWPVRVCRSHAMAIDLILLGLRLWRSATRKPIVCIRYSINQLELLSHYNPHSILLLIDCNSCLTVVLRR